MKRWLEWSGSFDDWLSLILLAMLLIWAIGSVLVGAILYAGKFVCS